MTALVILVSLVAITVICNLIGWTKFVFNGGRDWAQAEANCIVNLRIGARHICWGSVKAFRHRWGQKWWNPFPVWIEVGRPVSECGSREAFRIGCRWVNLVYRTRGETKPGDWFYPETGWHLKGTAPEFIENYGFWTWFWGWIPMRVWQTESPWDGGPWFYTSEDAGDFVASESAEEEGGSVKFTHEALRSLWKPGRNIESNGWSIKCLVVPRWMNVLEWNGW